MNLSADLQVALYAGLVFLASLAGGGLPLVVRLTHTRVQIAISAVAGLMLGLSLLHLLPHAIHHGGSVHAAVNWLLAGFLSMFLLQRFLPFHHHDVAEGQPATHPTPPPSLAETGAHPLDWMGVTLGLSLHSILDGLALAAGVAATAQPQGAALGLGTALAVILHKPFGAMAITTLMTASDAPRRWRPWVNVAFAAITPLGALLFHAGAGEFAQQHAAGLAAALAFCAGTFLCIAGSDLLPELHFHRHDRVPLSLALLCGIALALLIGHYGHAHAHSPPAPETTPVELPLRRLSHPTATMHPATSCHRPYSPGHRSPGPYAAL